MANWIDNQIVNIDQIPPKILSMEDTEMGGQATWKAHGKRESFNIGVGEYLKTIQGATRRRTCMGERTRMARSLHRRNVKAYDAIRLAQEVHEDAAVADYSQEVQTSLVSSLEALTSKAERARRAGHMDRYLQIHLTKVRVSSSLRGGQPDRPEALLLAEAELDAPTDIEWEIMGDLSSSQDSTWENLPEPVEH